MFWGIKWKYQGSDNFNKEGNGAEDDSKNKVAEPKLIILNLNKLLYHAAEL